MLIAPTSLVKQLADKAFALNSGPGMIIDGAYITRFKTNRAAQCLMLGKEDGINHDLKAS